MSSETLTQLTLGMRLNDEATFSNFLVAPDNAQLLETLTSPLEAGQLYYLWGSRGSGRSHLLQALCHAFSEAGVPALYLPLTELESLAPEILQQSSSLGLVCLDDLAAIAGDRTWEEAVFHCSNELMDAGVPLVVSADSAPRDLKLKLADLTSRLQRGLTFQVQAADEEFMRQIFQHRAERRGINLNEQVCDYILLRADRDLPALMTLLDRLDDGSLTLQRRITVPLVKELMNW